MYFSTDETQSIFFNLLIFADLHTTLSDHFLLVLQLVGILRKMNQNDLAEQLENKHKQGNVEFTETVK